MRMVSIDEFFYFDVRNQEEGKKGSESEYGRKRRKEMMREGKAKVEKREGMGHRKYAKEDQEAKEPYYPGYIWHRNSRQERPSP